MYGGTNSAYYGQISSTGNGGTFAISGNNEGLLLTSSVASMFTFGGGGWSTGLTISAVSPFTFTGGNIFLTEGATFQNTSGSSVGVDVQDTYNQVTSTAANTDLLINRTETSIGSGAQLLLNASVNNVSKFNISNTGQVYVSGNVGVGTTNPSQKLDVAGNINVSAGSAYMYNGANVITASTTLNNYFFGGAGNLTMTGGYNAANGTYSLYANTTGYGNVATGFNSLRYNTTGSSNVANGYQALLANTTGSSNTANGLDVLLSNTTGSNNLAEGFQAGYNSVTPLQTMSNSTFLGYGANSSVDGVTNSTAIGNGAQVTASNQMVLGNTSVTQTLLNGTISGTSLLFTASSTIGNGTQAGGLTISGGATTTGNAYFAGNVGIGTTSPGTLLSLGDSGSTNGINFTLGTSTFTGSAHGINITSGCFAINGACVGGTGGGGGSGTVSSGTQGQFAFYNSAGTTLSATSSIFLNTTNSYIGIGTTTPSALLSLQGSSGQLLDIAGSSGSSIFHVSSGGNVGIGTTTPWGNLSISSTNSSSPELVVGSTTATSLFVSNTGSVGIGTASPITGVLTVHETTNQNLTFAANGNGSYSGASGIQSINDANSAYVPLGFYASQYYLAGGNVGIGISTPSLTLDVRGVAGSPATTGTAQTGVARFTAASGSSAALDFGSYSSGLGTWLQSTNYANLATNETLSLNPNGGNVGIGTSTPKSLLSVGAYGTGSLSQSNVAMIANNNQETLGLIGNTTAANLNFYQEATTTRKAAVRAATGGSGSGGVLSLWTADDTGAITQRLTVDQSGNVGIGTTSPTLSPLTIVSTQNLNNLWVESNANNAGVTINNTQTGGRNWQLLSSGGSASVASSFRIFDGSSGGGDRLDITSSGNVGIGTSSPGVSGNATRTYLTLQGSSGTGQGDIQLGNFAAGNGNNGNIEWFDVGNTLSSSFRNAFITSGSSGSTANNLGAFMAFGTKADGSSGAGVERMRIDNAGNVGIGTVTPLEPLSVNGKVAIGDSMNATNLASANGPRSLNLIDTNAIARIWRYVATTTNSSPSMEFIQGTNNDATSPDDTWWDIYTTGASGVPANESMNFRRRTGNTSTNYMTVLNGGNVGIGTTTPWAKLSVTGPDTTNGYALDIADSANAPVFTIQDNGIFNFGKASTTTIPNNTTYAWTIATSTTANPLLSFSTVSGSEMVTIGTPGSDVVLGGTGASPNLIFQNSGKIMGSGAGQTITIGQGGDVVNLGGGSFSVSNAGTGPWTTVANFLTPNLASGNPMSMFLGVSTASYQSAQISYTYNSATPASSFASFAIQGFGYSGVNVTGYGTVGINTTSPSYALTVVATSTNIANFSGANSTSCTLSTGGLLACTSDARLKKDIATTTDALSGILALRPVSFLWKTDATSTTPNHGFIAQEVQNVFPDLVATDTSSGYLQLNMIGIIPYLTDAFQETSSVFNATGATTSAPSILSLYQGTTSPAVVIDAAGNLSIGTSTATTTTSQQFCLNGGCITSFPYSTSATSSTPTLSQDFLAAIENALTQWFSQAGNGIQGLFATIIHANEVDTQKLCVADTSGAQTCVTKSQLDTLLASAAAANTMVPIATSSAPVISVNGNSPATVQVGSTYTDLGAIITGPTADLNLGVMASVDGATSTALSDVKIDTSVPGMHTIQYSATDQGGLVGTATRTVNVVGSISGSTSTSTPTTTTTSTSTSTATSTPDTTATSTTAISTTDTSTSSATSTSTTP
jgi:hypothetical protein